MCSDTQRVSVLDEVNLAADINSGADDSYLQYITELGGKLYFRAYSLAEGYGLYVYDPVLDASGMVADINSGVNSYVQYITRMDGKLYFKANTDAKGYELFVFDPVLDSVNMVADINSGPDSSDPARIDIGLKSFTVMDDQLFFAGDNGSDGLELFTLWAEGVPVQSGDLNPGLEDFVFAP